VECKKKGADLVNDENYKSKISGHVWNDIEIKLPLLYYPKLIQEHHHFLAGTKLT